MIRPLTKRRKRDQSLYMRPPEVEAEIASAVCQDLNALRARLSVTAATSVDYLNSETLIYFIRNAFRAGDDNLRDTILTVLLGRCQVVLESKVSNRLPNAEAIRAEVLSAFTELLAQDAANLTSEALDYYECRFMRAFSVLRLGQIRKELTQLNRTTELPDETDQVETDGNAIAGRSEFKPLVSSFHEAASPEDAAYREQFGEALAKLPAKEAAAYILVRVMGYDEEADDPNKETAATRCGCTGRTIRNRLEKAVERLSKILSKEDL